jgi:hypothetical protein
LCKKNQELILNADFMSLFNNLTSTCSPYSQALGKPTIQFAEDNICGFVAQPANTFSNLAYLIIALKIALELKQAKNQTVLWGFVPVYALMGFTSAFYHASATFVGQFFDFGSMYIFSAFILFLAIESLKIWKTKSVLLILSFQTVILLILLWFLPFLRIWLFAIQIFIFLIIQLNHKSKDKTEDQVPKTNFKNLYLALFWFFTAWTFWWLDELNIWKDVVTMHYFNGHALWHALTAVSLYFVYKFYNSNAKLA